MTIRSELSEFTPEEYYRLERKGDAWEFREFRGLDAVLRIPPLRFEIPLIQIYRKIEFAKPVQSPA
jgi:hypothetical protein